jgi:pimeloyl-ACP methyl ester carboxylesterase
VQLDVETRFGSTHVLAAGPESGPTIVLLHAAAMSAPSWFASISALSKGHSVYAIDTIGDAGRSAQTARLRDGLDMSRWLDDVLAALDRERMHLVGLSYGGWLALNQACRSPGRLASIVSVDPPGSLGRPSLTFILRILPDGLLAKFAKSDKALYRLLRLLNNGTLPAQPLLDLAVSGLRTFRAQQPYPKRMTDDDLRMIATPTLLIFCERSPVNHAQRASQRARRFISNAETDVIVGAGHMLPVERPEVFATRILRFVERIDTLHQ